jgi:TonB family protein
MVLRFGLMAILLTLPCAAAAQANPPEIELPPDTSQGLLIYRVPPTYPPLALQARVQGTVVLQVLIAKDGTVQDLNVISGHPMLIHAAVDAVKQWRYRPYQVDGELFMVKTTVSVNFELSAPPAQDQPTPQATNRSPASGESSSPPAATSGSENQAKDPNSAPYRVGGGVSAPKLTYDPDPEYSEQARHARYQGTVVLWLVVDANGEPQNIKVQRSLGMGLDEEAVKAVRQWRFQPSMKDGQPVAVMINVEINFRLYRLSPHPESAGQPPRFPGVDTSKYPLVVHLTHAQFHTSREITVDGYNATISSAEQQVNVKISCNANSPNCLAFDEGTYPARWEESMKILEIMGLLDNNKKWTKTEYTVASAEQ